MTALGYQGWTTLGYVLWGLIVLMFATLAVAAFTYRKDR